MSARVLIVDDSKLDRVFIKKLLEYIGATAIEAASGRDCFRMCRNEKFDIILIDYLMPELDGIETLKQLNGSETKNADTPHVAMISSDDVADGRACIKAGFVNYLEKPIDFKQLMAILVMYLPDTMRKELKLLSAYSPNSKTKRSRKKDIDNQKNLSPKDHLKNVIEINMEQGISLCGSEEGYFTALGIFYNSIDVKANEIESYYLDGDWKNYTIKVHALKSSANIIGALKLYEDAKALEAAGNSNDMDMIYGKTKFLLEDYRSFKDKLSFLAEKKEKKPPAPDNEVADAYRSLVEISEIMDFDMADMIIKAMKEYELKEEDRIAFKEIEDKLTNLDWEGVTEIAQKHQ